MGMYATLKSVIRFEKLELDPVARRLRRAADVDDMAEVALRLGSDVPPRSVKGLRTWLRGMRDQLDIGEQARDTGRFLMSPPKLPLAARAPYTVVAAAAIGLLPTWARLELRLPPLPLVDRLAVVPAAKLLVGTLGWATGASPFKEAALERVGA